jgi:hypothetical protein
VLVAVLIDNFSLWLIPLLSGGLFAYTATAWTLFLDGDERIWIKAKVRNLVAFTS